MHQESVRQSTHVVFATLAVLLWIALPAWAVITIFLLMIGSGALLLRTEGKLANLLLRTLERERDRKRFPGKGAFLMVLGALLAAIIFPAYFIPGMLVLGISDALSTIVGKGLGKARLHKDTYKTWAGVGAFFVSSAAILFFFTTHWLIASILLATVEAADYGDMLILDDNLLIPLITGIILTVL